MTILNLQRRLAEIGRIRIGHQVATSSGKTRPAKLDTFRLTSGDRTRIDAAARIYGGTVQPWASPAGPQYEVVTETDSLPVIVPPSDMSFSQHYELWSAGGCQRRCDGRTEQITDGPCLCDPDQRECDIHTRLSVMLADVPGLGVWRIDTQGYYAAVELQGAVEIIQHATAAGTMLPARLHLQQRQVKRTGANGKPETRNFPVPVLSIDVTPAQLMAGTVASAELTNGHGNRAALPPTPSAHVPALEPPSPVRPVPTAPTRSIAEQAADVDRDKPASKPRKNAAVPIKPTGVRARSATEIRSEIEADTPPPDDSGDGATAPQVTAIITMLSKKFGINDRDHRLEVTGRVAGRTLGSGKDLTRGEASRVIENLDRMTPAELDGLFTTPAGQAATSAPPKTVDEPPF